MPGAAWLTLAACAVLALGLFVHFRPAREENQAVPVAARQARERAPSGSDALPAPREVAAAEENKSDPAAEREVASTSGEAAASPAPRRRIRVSPRVMGEALAEVEPERVATETHTLGVTGMPIYVSSPIPLPVAASERPLEVMFKDMSGGSRVVSVDPVTFGARDLSAQRARVANAKYTSSQGVW